MKLKNVQITNFRCFESLSLDLDSQLTVLVAKNGQGKSSVLDAIRIGLWAFVSGFDLARNPSNEAGNNISVDDVRLLKISDKEMMYEFPCKITLQGYYDIINVINSEDIGRLWIWSRSRESEAKGTKTRDDHNCKIIKSLAALAQWNLRNTECPKIYLPIVAYYGTGRLWSQKRLSKNKPKGRSKQEMNLFMRLFTYRDCLDPSSSYKHFSEWFTWIFECFREQQINEQEKGVSENNSVWKDTIQVVQEPINALLHETGWHSLEYSVSYGKTLILKHNEHGTLKVDSLSDGIRNVLAMVGDIAYRCIKLNPHLGLNAAKESSGVVMIDEIELHLHPAWQQTILNNLCKAFPKIQFIVTTHSPQVLSTIHRKSIRLLGKNINGKDVAVMPTSESYGEISNDVLQAIMHVDPQPPVAEKSKLERLTELVDQGLYQTPEAIDLIAKLKNSLSETHPQLQKLQRSIKRQEMLKA